MRRVIASPGGCRPAFQLVHNSDICMCAYDNDSFLCYFCFHISELVLYFKQSEHEVHIIYQHFTKLTDKAVTYLDRGIAVTDPEDVYTFVAILQKDPTTRFGKHAENIGWAKKLFEQKEQTQYITKFKGQHFEMVYTLK